MLAVVPKTVSTWRHDEASYIYSSTLLDQTPQDHIMAQIRPDKVEFRKIRKWLEFCEIYHSVGCCEAEKVSIVPASNNCEYIALSYDWGKGLEQP